METGTSTTGTRAVVGRWWARARPRGPFVAQVLLLTLVLWFVTVKLFISRHYVTPLGSAWGVADDVYVTASFGRTLAHGGGLVWYEGAPRVEGFTSPLWVLACSLIHLTPGFSEDALGLYVLAVNLLVVFGLSLAASTVIRARDASHRSLAPSWTTWLVLLALLLTCISAHNWTAGGFETGLTALFPLVAFALAGGPATKKRATALGLLLGAAFWSRMDSVLLCWPLLGVMWFEPRWRTHWLRTAGLLLIAALVLFAARRAYFGEWLPNTYYLKATQWPIAARVPQGYLQNRQAIYCLLFGVVPLTAFLLRAVPSRRGEILGLLMAYAGTVAYSTWIGGDFSYEEFGYDRFTGMGSLFLACGLSRLVTEASLSRALRAFAVACACALMTLPIFTQLDFWQTWHWRQPIDFKALIDFKFERSLNGDDLMTESFMYWGKATEQISKPGAVVAVCAAGAIPYFSKRKAIDLLGKVDKHVARVHVPDRTPPEFRCWRPWPGAGHNKEDLAHSFGMRPDVSTVEPPELHKSQYRKVSHAGLSFWLRRDSELVIVPEGQAR